MLPVPQAQPEGLSARVPPAWTASEPSLLVSSNGFDLQGAGRFGLRTVRIERYTAEVLRNRPGKKPLDASAVFLTLRSQLEHMEPTPDMSIRTLLELEGALAEVLL